jgi:hypothetical protein
VKTPKKPRNLQKLPTGKKKHQLDKTISPEMGDDENFQTGFLGALAPYNFLHVALRNFYQTATRARDFPNDKEAFKKAEKSQRDLWLMMATALLNDDPAFFQALANLMPLSKGRPAVDGVSPVIVWMMHFKQWNEDGAFQELFPEWPPTISELQKALGKFGVEADHKTIREKVKLLGYAVRPKGPGRK